jgi:hypothetical protein
MNSHKIREIIIGLANDPHPMRQGEESKLSALALVYLADKIEEATGDIGPAIENGLAKLSGEIADVSQTMRDGQMSIESIGTAIQGHASTVASTMDDINRRTHDPGRDR